jgi:hypothetical protein
MCSTCCRIFQSFLDYFNNSKNVTVHITLAYYDSNNDAFRVLFPQSLAIFNEFNTYLRDHNLHVTRNTKFGPFRYLTIKHLLEE